METVRRETNGVLKKIRGKDKNCKKDETTLSDIVASVKWEKKTSNRFCSKTVSLYSAK